jgi:hypothetical protein
MVVLLRRLHGCQARRDAQAFVMMVALPATAIPRRHAIAICRSPHG